MNSLWNVILKREDGNKILRSQNNPKISGRYLCTCVKMYNREECKRYLQVMEYDAEKEQWHDCGNKSGISHSILAWTDKVPVCDFADFFYSAGHFIEKTSDTDINFEADKD